MDMLQFTGAFDDEMVYVNKALYQISWIAERKTIQYTYKEFKFLGIKWQKKVKEEIIYSHVMIYHIFANASLSIKCLETVSQVIQAFEEEENTGE